MKTSRTRKRCYANIDSVGKEREGEDLPEPATDVPVSRPTWYLPPTPQGDLSLETLEAAVMMRVEALAGPSPADGLCPLDPSLDLASHLALRLAVARCEDGQHPSQLCRWWVDAEGRAFQARLASWLRSSGLGGPAAPPQAWWRDFGLDYGPPEHRSAEAATAAAAASDGAGWWCGDDVVVAVPFVEAAHLIRRRRVALRLGMALVPFSAMPALVTARFRAHLGAQVLSKLGRLSAAQPFSCLLVLSCPAAPARCLRRSAPSPTARLGPRPPRTLALRPSLGRPRRPLPGTPASSPRTPLVVRTKTSSAPSTEVRLPRRGPPRGPRSMCGSQNFTSWRV